MGESRKAYRVLVGRPEGKIYLGRPRRRWEDNIQMDLREVGYDDRDWINLARDRDQWRAYVQDGNEPPGSLKAIAIIDLTVFREVHRVDRPPGHGKGFQPPCRNVDRGYCPRPASLSFWHHHGTACPHVADRGDGLQIWRVAANILNKQSWTADKEEEMILGDMLLELHDSCEQYGMKINANKTKTMVIGSTIKVTLRILNEAVEQVDSFKYLGSKASELEFDQHPTTDKDHCAPTVAILMSAAEAGFKNMHSIAFIFSAQGQAGDERLNTPRSQQRSAAQNSPVVSDS
ncbi:hypothetical protein ANN_23988 [Periplaneta americana]|uniref:Reverse transcriptase domain-containing protein n=1 Tax=Periplaneta americana TaxID=6978 RepID=A0ABQ8S226_PERAM|nr:hypothetical protein ANN_23988 [Periplaneta americana]